VGIISKDQTIRCPLNFSLIIKQLRTNWVAESEKGRVLLTKAKGISHLTYAAIQFVKKLIEWFFDFTWKNWTHYIKKSFVIHNSESGGFNFLDFNSLNNTFKINWATHFLNLEFYCLLYILSLWWSGLYFELQIWKNSL